MPNECFAFLAPRTITVHQQLHFCPLPDQNLNTISLLFLSISIATSPHGGIVCGYHGTALGDPKRENVRRNAPGDIGLVPTLSNSKQTHPTPTKLTNTCAKKLPAALYGKDHRRSAAFVAYHLAVPRYAAC